MPWTGAFRLGKKGRGEKMESKMKIGHLRGEKASIALEGTKPLEEKDRPEGGGSDNSNKKKRRASSLGRE